MATAAPRQQSSPPRVEWNLFTSNHLPGDCWEVIVGLYIQLPAPEDAAYDMVPLNNKPKGRLIGLFTTKTHTVTYQHHYEIALRVSRQWREIAQRILRAPSQRGLLGSVGMVPARLTVAPTANDKTWCLLTVVAEKKQPEPKPPTLMPLVVGPMGLLLNCLASQCSGANPSLRQLLHKQKVTTKRAVVFERGHYVGDEVLAQLCVDMIWSQHCLC